MYITFILFNYTVIYSCITANTWNFIVPRAENLSGDLFLFVASVLSIPSIMDNVLFQTRGV